ncbi:caspase-1-A-like [Archocentrus centrarchus]|uniref:caspase-1-A-like n=1 Tax=Archocentrus centrarchus TaxID=63155 RepID=UPI0011E9B4A8|nr:caspase-1-A-like [Archocentrus centrarchus]
MAVAALTGVRTGFVDNVSKPVIKQLLDDLVEGGVLNDGESESVREDNGTRADMARDLIDIVRKKGDKASSKMITYIQRRDSSLYEKLGLLDNQPAPEPLEQEPSKQEPPKQEEWSDTLKHTTEQFWRGKLRDNSIYPVTKEAFKNRVALLITNIKFTDATLNRNGAEKDQENMEKLLSALGYEVVKYTNLTGKEINEALIEFSKHPKLKETDSVVVVIMSHGKLGAVLGVDYKKTLSNTEKQDEFPIDNIYKQLGPEKCRALLDKPKIIIIQACRGEKAGAVLVSDSTKQDLVCDDVKQPSPSLPAEEEGLEDDTLRCVHKEKDFICLLSCTPDTVSYRQRDHGSILIQYIVQVFNTFAHEDDIEELFRKVMHRFEDFKTQNKRQMPTKDRCTLIRRFYFFPGL